MCSSGDLGRAFKYYKLTLLWTALMSTATFLAVIFK